MARYLVTGGAGFIGSHLVDSLLADGDSVRILDDLSTGNTTNVSGTVALEIADVADRSAVRRALQDIDGCFHLAAIASVERCNREWLRSHQTNLTGTLAVFEEVCAAQDSRNNRIPVVYASSAAVYGNPRELPITENAETFPINAYGVDKLGCDLHASVGRLNRSMTIIGLRFFNIYGPRQDPRSPYSGVISIFCEQILKGLSIEVHGDGEQMRDFVYVGDAVEALRCSMASARSNGTSDVFNVCSGSGTTVTELGHVISQLESKPFTPTYLPARPGDIKMSIGDPRYASGELGFSTKVSLKEGLTKTLEWLRKPLDAENILHI